MTKNKSPHYSVCIGVGYVICTVQLENSNFLCGALAVIIVIIITMIKKKKKKIFFNEILMMILKR